MCYFITLGLPGQCQELLEQRVPRGFAVHAVENRSVLEKLPQGYRTWLLTSGGCSCDLFVSPSKAGKIQGEIAHAQARHQSRLRARRVKQGWSEAKIARAEEQSRQTSNETLTPDWVGLRDDVREIIAALASEAGPVLVLAHWYDDSQHEHVFELGPAKTVSKAEFAQAGTPLEADQLLCIKA